MCFDFGRRNSSPARATKVTRLKKRKKQINIKGKQKQKREERGKKEKRKRDGDALGKKHAQKSQAYKQKNHQGISRKTTRG